MSIRAIITGATGMVGEGVLHEALTSPAVESVLVLGRRPCGVAHPKLNELLVSDFYDLTAIRDRLKGYNACFFCLGSTSLGKSEQEYRRMTYDLTMSVARTLAELNGDMVFCYVSGLGTDSTEQGRIAWARIKGKTENDLRTLPFKAAYAYRPGFIKPTPGMKNTIWLAKILAPLFPALRLLMPKSVCTLEELGRSMIRIAADGYPKRVLECVDIVRSAEMASVGT